MTGFGFSAGLFVTISIHTAYASGDASDKLWLPIYRFISIHTAYASGDDGGSDTLYPKLAFRSTPHTQAVTRDCTGIIFTTYDFDPHRIRKR